jgi:hypothetical protein
MASDDMGRRVADELAIRNLIAKISMAADTAEDLTEYASLFSEDAHWEVVPEKGQTASFAPITGRKNILAAALQRRKDRLSGPGTHSYHNLVMTQVTLQGDRASASSHLLFIKNANIKPSVEMFKIYKDQFTRETEGWKLNSRYILPG